ncbi:MAG: hypothetical protein WC326_12965 [Candidatus Delongbacteria bacterium]
MKPEPGKVDTGTRGGFGRSPRCNRELEDGRLCRQPVPMAGMRCYLHQAKPEDLVPAPDLPAGVVVPSLFQDPAWQLSLVGFVADIYRDYAGLNKGADLRQILAAGAAHVRLTYGMEALEPKDIELLSRVVDRHLRNLRATPKEQEAGRAGKDGKGALGALAAGVQVGALLERVRGALSPAQRRALAAGRPIAGAEVLQANAPAVAPDEAEVLDDEDDLGVPRPIGLAGEDLPPDPFA